MTRITDSLDDTPDTTAATPAPASANGAAPETFAALWDSARHAHADRTFLLFEDGNNSVHEWTYGEFGQVVDHFSRRLRKAGVDAGDGVHVCLRNCPAFVAIWLAAARIGAWIIPVDPTAGAREISQHFDRTQPRLGIHGRDRREAYLEATASSKATLWEFTETASDVRLPADGSAADPNRTEVATSAAGPRDRLAVMFTSGTTSQPKGVVLTQRNYHYVAVAMARAAGLQAEHRWFVTLPLFHANAQYYCFAPAIAVGASVALSAGFSASRWVHDAIALRATHASLFAAPIRMILARTPRDQPPASLEHVWYAQNLGAEHHHDFARLAGVAPRQLYGMTETIPVVTYDRSPEPAHDVIGEPLEGRTVRLVHDAKLVEVGPGETGMIAVAGRRGEDLFDEYLDAPEITARTLVTGDDGTDWLLTGDLAADTGSRGWRFVGRADDVIKVAGENVSLTEVEAALAQAPGVLEAAVLPQADPIRDWVPIAYVVPRDRSAPPDATALDLWAESNLAKAARPRAWHLIEELPRTSVGKVRRFKLDAPSNGEQ